MSTQKPHAKEPGAALQLAQDLPVRSPQAADKGLVVGISSRVLFDLTESDEVFRNQGVDAYREHQVARENTILQPGSAYALVEKLSRLSAQLPEPGIEVVLLSRNTADTGLRVFKSIECYELKIERAVFCGGETPYRYVQALGCDLFLSTEVGDVRQALEHGVAAATILSAPPGSGRHTEQLRLAFDGDAVLFSDEAERVYQHQGLSDFHEHEKSKAQSPPTPGAADETAHRHTRHTTKVSGPKGWQGLPHTHGAGDSPLGTGAGAAHSHIARARGAD